MNISTAARILELLDPKPDFGERDFGGEKQFAGAERRQTPRQQRPASLCGAPTRRWYRRANPHKLTSRTRDLMVIRSKFTPASGDVANAATISRPEIGRRIRSNSSARTTTTASRPCSVTRCGPRCWAWRTTSRLPGREWPDFVDFFIFILFSLFSRREPLFSSSHPLRISSNSLSITSRSCNFKANSTKAPRCNWDRDGLST
jgi:hypothetical protein